MSIASYVQDLNESYKTGIAREHAYRPALKALFDGMEKGVNAVNDAKRIDVGAPDLIVLKHNIPVGIAEAKDIGIPLDKEEKSEQMERYHKIGNVILTDYLEFRWYVDGQKRDTVRVAEVHGKHIQAVAGGFSALESMIKSFLLEEAATIRSAKELAQRMAGIAQVIRQLIEADLKSAEPSKELLNQLNAFQKTLLPDMQVPDFADMFAQTLAYGLFAARVNYAGASRFNRHDAARFIPQTNPFLRRLFHDMSFDVGEKITWLVDRLAELLAHADTDAILKDFGKATRQEDPVVHFYETFLSAYDPALRDKRGVYYTPAPVVSYIVRSVDKILQSHFGREQGLADENTMILDPATGTGTFLYFVIEQIQQRMAKNKGAWASYVNTNLLPRLFGFELLVAPYTVAHMKLGLQLKDLGYEFAENRRLGIYLTNTLEEAVKKTDVLWASHIVDEANEAAAIKREKPIMVVLGNPPYSGHSSNTGEWITNLVRSSYYPKDAMREQNPKLLLDDYVKFIRFGQWRIEATGSGVLAFVTNHGYLENSTFREMRKNLLQTFSRIYIIDLHGNARKKETTPEGLPDTNVFDIQQGVAIGIFVKEEGYQGIAKVYHQDVWGTRQNKYEVLNASEIDGNNWKVLAPQSPYFLFTPYEQDIYQEYQYGWSLIDIFPINGTGIKTHRDKFVVEFDYPTLEARISEFRDLSVSTQSLKEKYKIEDTRDWKINEHRQNLSNNQSWKSAFNRCLYRPFDWRDIYYSSSVIELPRTEIMQNMLHDNLGMGISRGYEISRGFEHVLCTNALLINHTVSLKEANYLAPLYLYPEQKKGEMFALVDDGSAWPLSEKGRRPNLNPEFVKAMEAKLGLKFVPERNPTPQPPTPLRSLTLTDGEGEKTDEAVFYPEDVFHYAYAVFHSPSYRERYAEFLKIDFPRLPLTGDVALFRQLCGYGESLVAWHLLKHRDKDKGNVSFDVAGSSEVAQGYPRFVLEKDTVKEIIILQNMGGQKAS